MIKYYNIVKKYFLVLILALLSIQVEAQDPKLIRECDSLHNLISKEKDTANLAILYYDLATRCFDLYKYDEAQNYADSSAIYADISKKMWETLIEDFRLIGKINVYIDKPEEAIRNFVNAQKILESHMPDEDKKATIEEEIAMVYFNRGHYERALQSLKKAENLYILTQNKDKEIGLYSYIATCYHMLEKIPEEITYYEKLLEVYKLQNNLDNMKVMYQRLGDLYIANKDYDNSLNSNRKLYDLCCENNNISESLNALNNLAYCYVCKGEYNKAIQYYNQLINSDQKFSKDERLDAVSYTNLGMCYQNLGNKKACFNSLTKAADIRLRYRQYKEYAEINNVIALIYLQDKDLYNADNYSKISVKYADKSGDIEVRKDCYDTYSKILNEKGEYEESMNVQKNYLAIKDSVNMQRDFEQRQLNDDYRQLIEAEKDQGDILAERRLQNMVQREQELIIAQREQENQMLLKDRDLQKILNLQLQQANQILLQEQEAIKARQTKDSIEREAERQRRLMLETQQNLEKKKQQAEEETKRIEDDLKRGREKALQFSIIGGIVLLLCVLALILFKSKNKKLNEQKVEIESKNADLLLKNEEITVQKENLQKANENIIMMNEEIIRQKENVENANKSLTDSIVYAKRIQQAVCPKPEFLKNFNLDYFMFFRPRDIVSGDFFWFTNIGNYVFIAAADCTGHGVPGAFMSMLGVSLLNKIVSERNIFNPEEILNNLRTEVKSALHQQTIGNSSAKDGMDISFVRFDLQTKILAFSGANNNGYLVQKFAPEDESEAHSGLGKKDFVIKKGTNLLRMKIMEADSMPIGVYLKDEKPFSLSSFQLRSGDSFYLTSDGYIDQFGGEHGRKFLKRNFETMLLDMNDKDMESQKKFVEQTHEEWLGTKYTQLDDIIVIGIKIK
ncbi:MAG: tetratricopeptide repeat protein [Bacteroidales bacterium]|nr:tetratricopeptide repeat protein [Bacteroidales bacterium]